MLLTVPKLLNPAQLEKIHEVLAGAQFVDGRLTAGFAAARVKHNLEMQQDPERIKLIIRILMASLAHNETLPLRCPAASGGGPHRRPLRARDDLRRSCG